MESNFYLDFKPQDEMSDTISTSAASLNYLPFEDTSPSNALSTNSIDNDILYKSKKIRKKRNAYQKIDDDIRLKLLEAVQRGETLKSAAKRYQVNYSSAKSIFHIFRKEGRILKKVTQEKNFEFDLPMQSEMEMNPQLFMNPSVVRLHPSYQRPSFSQAFSQSSQTLDFRPDRMFNSLEEMNGTSSPINGLVDNFAEFLKIGNTFKPKEDIMKNKAYMPTFPSRFNPNQKMNLVDYNFPKMQVTQQMCLTPTLKPSTNTPIANPIERMKQFDNFYMNYSNSPLSGNARMIREGSESGSNRYVQGEFDSFSEMVTAFQSQPLLIESMKKDISIPKLVMPNLLQPVENSEVRMSLDEEMNWTGSLENAAIDTFKTFIDAHMVLSNAFKKASYLNNLVQIQKSNSPKFLSFQGN
jgi:hypothetical protein